MMDVRAFRNSPSGRLVARGDSWAFVPNPLPPRLVVDSQLSQLLLATDQVLADLARLGHSLPDPHQSAYPLMRREAVFSNRLSGRRVDLIDLYAYQAGQPVLPVWQSGASQDDVRAVLAYVDAMEYGLQRRAGSALNLRLIRELHAGLLGSHSRERGRQNDPAGSGGGDYGLPPSDFRATLTWIGPPGSGLKEADYVPPPVEELQPALHNLEAHFAYTAHSSLHPLVRLACIHYQFEAIHPFLDGNGRLGRLIIVLLMCQWGLLPQLWLPLSVHFERYAEEYAARLLAVSRDGDWRTWVVFFLQGVESQARAARRRMRALMEVDTACRAQIEQSTVSAPQRVLALRLLDRLFETPILSVAEAQRILEVNPAVAPGVVEYLVEVGILTPVAYPETRAGQLPPVYAAMQVLSAIVL
jgi:Fic family protein